MSRHILGCLISFLLLFSLVACSSPKKSSESTAKSSLKAYESGQVTLAELTELDSGLRQKIIHYYEKNPGAVSEKSKLVVSRSYFCEENYTNALPLAKRYVAADPSDYRGWRLLGATYLKMGSYDGALWGYTNAVMLGDAVSYVTLLGVALNARQTNIIQDIIPNLLIVKASDKMPLYMRVEIAGAMALYAGRTQQEDVFIRALEGFTPEELLTNKDYSRVITRVYDYFQSPEVKDLCTKLKEHLGPDPAHQEPKH